MNFKRLIGGLSFLTLFTGVLLLLFIPGGFLNPYPQVYVDLVGPRGILPGGVSLDQPGHIAGFVLLGVGAVGFVVLWSLKRPGEH
jgi:hypothetical protein